MIRVVVVGAGISGLAAAFALQQRATAVGLNIDLQIFEKEDRTGGKILSIKEDGFLCEWGPNGFLDNKPMTLELCDTLGIRDRMLRSDDNARKRFIYSEKLLHRLPEGGPSFLASKLISWPGKMRLACEPFIPAKRDDEDETLADFGRRRLGAEALDKLIAPMVSGIFAGDPETMSLRSCFPRIHELEMEYGGLIKAMMMLAKKKKAERKAGKAVASAAGPGGVLTSFIGGIQELTNEAQCALGDKVRTGAAVNGILPKKDGFEVHLADGSMIDADIVISAAPAFALSSMLNESLPPVAELLNGIPYSPLFVVCFGYERDKIARDLDGFGYLIPKKEGCNTLGTLWDSSIFPNRAPAGKVLLRSMIGGAANPGVINLPESEIQTRVMADLKQIMGIDAAPDFVRVFRHERAIPQYRAGHAARLVALDEQLQRKPGLFLTGNAFFGVGLNDCVNAANRVAEQALDFIRARS
ncbi:MAG: protoporphyrinogen oxidase [Desulfuromonadales bacterium]|nr:protoporphyrinogen oxidase [Desulfuromonadales bacterium]